MSVEKLASKSKTSFKQLSQSGLSNEVNSPKATLLTVKQVTSPKVIQMVPSPSSRPTSRQSIASSQLSMATTTSLDTVPTARSDSCSEFEPLLKTRWDNEAEMDKGLKIQKRKHAATKRLRKMNEVYERLLGEKIRLLDSNLSNVEKELTKETRFIKDEIKEYNPVIQFPRIDSATPVESRSSSRLSGKNRIEKICDTCMFDPTNTNLRCRHFPCFLPATYNSITFTTKPPTYSVVSNYNQLLQRCKDVRPATSSIHQNKIMEEEAISSESHPPRTSVKEKIRGLKQLVKEMKERNEKTKPRDWATNYGDPVPRRIILKPVKTV